MASSQVECPEGEVSSKRSRVSDQPIIGFSKEDKVGTIEPHDDAPVVTLQMRGMMSKQ